jgi:hypothetical protein
MKKTFKTWDYRFSHGRMPRGEGTWAFCDDNLTGRDYLQHAIFSPPMAFSEAKKWAAEHPKLKDARVIAVLP